MSKRSGNYATAEKEGHCPMWCRRTHFQWLGWDDVRRGLGITKARQRDLDNLPARSGPEGNTVQTLQQCYELGRQQALGYKLEWGVVPEWRRDEKLGQAIMREFFPPNQKRSFEDVQENSRTIEAAAWYHTQFMGMEAAADRSRKLAKGVFNDA